MRNNYLDIVINKIFCESLILFNIFIRSTKIVTEVYIKVFKPYLRINNLISYIHT